MTNEESIENIYNDTSEHGLLAGVLEAYRLAAENGLGSPLAAQLRDKAKQYAYIKSDWINAVRRPFWKAILSFWKHRPNDFLNIDIVVDLACQKNRALNRDEAYNYLIHLSDPANCNYEQMALNADGVTKAAKLRAMAKMNLRFLQMSTANSIAELQRIEEEYQDTATRFNKKANDTKIAFTLRELMTSEDEHTNWSIRNMLPEGLTLIAAKPKTGKSWLVSSIGLALVSQGYAFGSIPVQRGDVLYLALEDSRKRLKRRFMQMLADGDTIPEGYDFRLQWPRGQAGLDAIEQWLKDHPQARMVIIDTLAKFKDRQRNTNGPLYDSDSEVMEPIQSLALKYGVSIIVVHHTRKAKSDDVFDEISGSTGLTGPCDMLWVLDRAQGEENKGKAILHIRGRDIEEDQEHIMLWSPEMSQWTITKDQLQKPRSPERQCIVAALNILKRATPEQVASHTGKSYSSVKKLLWTMADEEDGVISDHGFYSLLIDSPQKRVTQVTEVTRVTEVTQVTLASGGYLGYSEDKGKVTQTSMTDTSVSPSSGDTVTPVTPVTQNTHNQIEAKARITTCHCGRPGTRPWNGGSVICEFHYQSAMSAAAATIQSKPITRPTEPDAGTRGDVA